MFYRKMGNYHALQPRIDVSNRIGMAVFPFWQINFLSIRVILGGRKGFVNGMLARPVHRHRLEFAILR